MDLLDTKFGVADRQAVIKEIDELLSPYSFELLGTYDQFLNKTKRI
jgi:hypothetical protein